MTLFGCCVNGAQSPLPSLPLLLLPTLTLTQRRQRKLKAHFKIFHTWKLFRFKMVLTDAHTPRGGPWSRGRRSRWDGDGSRGTAASPSASVSVQRCGSTAASAANLLRPGNTFHVAPPPLQSADWCKRCRPAAAAINQNLISNSDVNSKRQRRCRRRRSRGRRRRRSLPKKIEKAKEKTG